MCTTVPLSGHHDFIMELLFGVRQKSHQSFCEVEKTVFFTFSSRWSFISLRLSHLKGVTFYRLYEIKSVPDRKEMSQVISANANTWYLSFPTNSTISPQKLTIFAFNVFHGMLVTNIIWIWISFEWEKISGVTWKIIERPIDWLLSNSFEIQFGWVENQLRKRLALKFGISNSQKFRCDKKVCQPELDKNKHWPHVFNRLADGVFFFQISKFHLCIIKKRNIQQTYYLSNIWPAHLFFANIIHHSIISIQK